MIVVDTNILVYSLITFPKSILAEKLRAAEADWRTSPLWIYEFGNALTIMVKQNQIRSSLAHETMTQAENMFGPCEMPIDGDLALRLALQRKLTFYDAQYLALAQTLGVPLITEDKELQKAGDGLAVSMEEFLGN